MSAVRSCCAKVFGKDMSQYILLIHGNTTTQTKPEEWDHFFMLARQSGLFKGGSEIGNRVVIGQAQALKSSDHITGFMRFDSENRQEIVELLEVHPVVLNGGAVELCEMPKS